MDLRSCVFVVLATFWTPLHAQGLFTTLKVDDCTVVVVNNYTLFTIDLRPPPNGTTSFLFEVPPDPHLNYYAPCGGITLFGACNNVSSCIHNIATNLYYDFGSSTNVMFGNTDGNVYASYSSVNGNPFGIPRSNKVNLVCNETTDGVFTLLNVIGGIYPLQYVTEFQSRRACPVEASHSGGYTISKLNFYSALLESFADGLQIIDLSPLASATFITTDNLYVYSPGSTVTRSGTGACVNVTLCENDIYDLGDASLTAFAHNGQNVVAHYRSFNQNGDGQERNTFVTLVCDTSVDQGELTLVAKESVKYAFEFRSKYACLQDYNECGNSNGGCAQGCNNTEGSFYCYCYDGYILDSDGTSCNDIDECMDNNGSCSIYGGCNNTHGGFYCYCNDGYTIGADNATCTDIDECVADNGGCNQTCSNTMGSYFCSCGPGYTIDADEHNCNEIPMCELGICKNGGNCTVQGPLISCVCVEGYTGQFCEEYLGCNYTYCKNGGTCFLLEDRTYICACPRGFDSYYCETQVPVSLLTDMQIILIGAIGGGGILIVSIMLLAALICCCRCCCHEKKEEKDEVEMKMVPEDY